MSYLDVPRLQFGGLFFTAPSTINNYIGSYDESVQLQSSSGQFLDNQPNGGPSGWNATGVAQTYLTECTVLSAVGPDGTLVDAANSDPVVGARVETPSPQTPQRTADGSGFFDLAKLVDLDPMQQIRSRGYGLRVYVNLVGTDGSASGGLSGLMSVPELRYMSTRVPIRWGSWAAVGTWLGRIADVDWHGDISGSPLLQQLQQASARHGLSVKIAMDLHQNASETRNYPTDLFCYGRVTGAIGPAQEGELDQVVPGRVLWTAPSAQPESEAVSPEAVSPEAAAPEAASPEAASPETSARLLGGRLAEVIGQSIDDRMKANEEREKTVTDGNTAARPEALDEDDTSIPWNGAFALVREVDGVSTVHLDLSSAITLQYQWQDLKLQGSAGPTTRLPTSNGKFVVNDSIQVGVLNGGTVQPLTHGAIRFSDQYVWHDAQTKAVYLLKNSAMVDVPLTADEAALVAKNPLVISAGGTSMLQEPSDGYFMDLSLDTVRLYAGDSTEIQVMARQWGQPLVGQQPVSWQMFVTDESRRPRTTNDITVRFDGSTDANGIATLQVTATSANVTLPSIRQPLDSQIYFGTFVDPTGTAIGDGGGNYNLSVLFWPPFTAPANPTWDADIGPILEAYARLYPGMRGRLDIGDETTVKGFAGSMYDRMSMPFDDPAYMPVTRDLAPPKVKMILDWLKPFTP